jgi:hypothetical protein
MQPCWPQSGRPTALNAATCCASLNSIAPVQGVWAGSGCACISLRIRRLGFESLRARHCSHRSGPCHGRQATPWSFAWGVIARNFSQLYTILVDSGECGLVWLQVLTYTTRDAALQLRPPASSVVRRLVVASIAGDVPLWPHTGAMAGCCDGRGSGVTRAWARLREGRAGLARGIPGSGRLRPQG